jgi:hypothetical protein
VIGLSPVRRSDPDADVDPDFNPGVDPDFDPDTFPMIQASTSALAIVNPTTITTGPMPESPRDAVATRSTVVVTSTPARY